jgi:invasion protein IalB
VKCLKKGKMNMGKHDAGVSKSGMAIAGLILGIIALITSWMPFLNNMSFFIALVGVVLAIVGVVSTVKGTHSGKALAIVAIVINIVAMAAVLAAQSATETALNKAINGPSVSNVSESTTTDDSGSTSDASTATDSGSTSDASTATDSDQEAATTDLAVGTSVSLDNGLSVSVDSVNKSVTNVTNLDGSSVVGVQVTYTNNGSDSKSYNFFDWKGEDSNGAQEDPVTTSIDEDALWSGSLAAGGSKSGMLYFKDGTVKVLYFGTVVSNDAAASWDIA